MAQVNSIAGGIEDQFVHADRIAFAEGRISISWPPESRTIFWIADRGAGGRVFFLLVMTFENLPRIFVFQGGSGGRGNFEKQVYADRKIRSVKKAGLR